jgi:uncharacterized membrane protein YeiH
MMNSFETWGSTLLPTIELLATLAFALSGIMEAASKRMDVVGVCVVGFLAAFGGGTLRDILLDQRPFFWVENEIVLWAVLGLCILSISFMRQRHFDLTEKTLQWPDTLGLGLFTASGVAQSLALGLSPTVAALKAPSRVFLAVCCATSSATKFQFLSRTIAPMPFALWLGVLSSLCWMH